MIPAVLKSGVPIPKIVGRGRPKGIGRNVEKLASMKPGDSLWELTRRKAMSFRVSAACVGIKVTIRKIDGTTRYALFIL